MNAALFKTIMNSRRAQAPWQIAVVLLALAAPVKSVRAEADTPWWLSDHERSAGPRCLGFVAKYLGKNWSYGEIARAFPDATDGASLEQIQAAAHSLGLYAEIFSGDAPFVTFSPYPVIVGRMAGQRQSYRVILGRTTDDQRLRVFEFPAKLTTVDHRSFGFSYQGRALVVSTRPLGDVTKLLLPRVPLYRRGAVQATAVGLVVCAAAGFWIRQRR